MGIQGLLPFLKKSSRSVNLSEFKGKTAAVDVYCWLHKGAFSCAEKLVKGEPTDGYIVYVMKQVSLLLTFNIKPILVFDGCHLPAKEVTELKRRENREKNRRKAKELLREGKVREARECFQRCVDVSPSMAHEVIKACRARNVDVIVAPYEADAQLAFFSHCGIADIVITEDSDLVLFGCDKIIFKIDNNGGGMLVEKEKLHFSMNVPRDKFDFMKFRNMCILSGCDYLPSLHGIGLAKACRFFIATSNPDVFNSLCKLPTFLKMFHLDVTLEYRRGFMKAIDTILHQLVFDPFTRTLRPLTPYPSGISYEEMPYCGEFVGHERALQIALGNVDVQTGEIIDNYDPLKSKGSKGKSTGWHDRGGNLLSSHPSIWDTNYKWIKASLEAEQERKCDESGIIMRGKERSVESPFLKRQRAGSEVTPENVGISEDYLESLYTRKRRKKDDDSDRNSEEKSSASERKNPDDEGTKEKNESRYPPGVSSSANTGEIDGNSEVDEAVNEVSRTEMSTPNYDGYKSPISQPPSKIFTTSNKPTPKTSRNPFVKKTSPNLGSGNKDAVSKFSALTEFTRSPQQRPTIVRSRYFKATQDNGVVTDVNSQNENKCYSELMGESLEQLDQDKGVDLPEFKEEKFPSIVGSPLKLRNEPAFTPGTLTDCTLNSRIESGQKNSFKWRGQLSQMFSFRSQRESRRRDTSIEEDLGLLTPSCLSDGGMEDGNDAGTHCEEGKRGAIEFPVEGLLTPPNDSDDGGALPSRGDVEVKGASRPSFSSPLQLELSKGSGMASTTPKCRVSGLRRSTKSPASKQRQLSLKEMFAFKKDVVN